MGKKPVPLLIISDSPDAGSGLGRITRDLATRIHEHMQDTFRVGVLGYGGPGSRKFGFSQYHIEGIKTDWIIPNLPEVCEDFFGEENGYCLCIWDISRLGWFSRPEAHDLPPYLKQFLLNPPFRRWLYTPVDAEGPNYCLTFPLREALKGFDRILAYGKWSADVLDRTMGREEGTTPHLPHGLNLEVFRPRNRKFCRSFFPSISESFMITGNQVKAVDSQEILVGCVCTNQSRKDLPLAIEAFSRIRNVSKRLWIKTDNLEKAWSIPALLLDYGIEHSTAITLSTLSDDQMAQMYSACDITLAPGLGEGFCFPAFESIACQTPCIHGNYAQAPQWMHPSYLVEPIAYRYEGIYSCKRPVFSAQDWVDKMNEVLQCVNRSEVKLNADLDWNNLWPHWQKWLQKEVE